MTELAIQEDRDLSTTTDRDVAAGMRYRLAHLSMPVVLGDMSFGTDDLGPGDRIPDFDLPTLDGGRFRDGSGAPGFWFLHLPGNRKRRSWLEPTPRRIRRPSPFRDGKCSGSSPRQECSSAPNDGSEDSTCGAVMSPDHIDCLAIPNICERHYNVERPDIGRYQTSLRWNGLVVLDSVKEMPGAGLT